MRRSAFSRSVILPSMRLPSTNVPFLDPRSSTSTPSADRPDGRVAPRRLGILDTQVALPSDDDLAIVRDLSVPQLFIDCRGR